ncbi:MAG TPA: DUF3987 domain-containing protein, partial [Clostridia bacterium]|nr:DUF3987 domain-containing protein [Clostridia bacterium]
RYPPGRRVPDKVNLARGLDIRANGGLVVCPPSLHPSGRRYEWELSSHPDDTPLADVPDWLLAQIDRPKQTQRLKVPDVIPQGCRNDTLFRVGASLRDKGLSHDAILAALREENKTRCDLPLSDDEVESVARQAAKYEPKHDYAKGGAVDVPPVTDDWPKPEEIKPENLLPVEPLNPEIIPEGLRDWCVDAAFRMQCPVDFTAVGAVVVASSIIGAGCAIRPKQNDDWEVVPNLWGGIVARPSMMKTPSLAEVMKPIAQMEAEGKEAYNDSMRLHSAKQEAQKACREAIRQDMVQAAKGKGQKSLSDLEIELAALEPKPEPARKRYRTSDATVEKLGELLSENPRGILVFRDEMTGLLSSWDREDRQTDRAFFLEGWDGNQPYTTDRIVRGTIDVANICISILGGIQPAKLTAYLLQAAGNLTNDGMIQRFQLLVYPDEPKSWKLVDEVPDQEARRRGFEVFKELAKADPLSMGASGYGEDGRPYFRFDDEGQAVYFKWSTEIEGKIRSEERPLMCEHLGKYRSLMPSLALIFHMVHVVSGAAPGPVSGMAARMAVKWCDYLERHARRIYGLLWDVRQRSAAALAKKIRAGSIKDGFTAREIYLKGWHLVDTPELVKDACRELIEAGWIREETTTSGGRPKIQFRINPKLRQSE